PSTGFGLNRQPRLIGRIILPGAPFVPAASPNARRAKLAPASRVLVVRMKSRRSIKESFPEQIIYLRLSTACTDGYRIQESNCFMSVGAFDSVPRGTDGPINTAVLWPSNHAIKEPFSAPGNRFCFSPLQQAPTSASTSEPTGA